MRSPWVTSVAAKPTFQIRGVTAMVKRLKKLGSAWPVAVEKALHQESSDVLDKIEERTPVDEGPLRGSLDLQVERKVGEIKSTFQVGGPSADYATRVHEDASMEHTVGEAFFMKNEIDAQQAKLPGNLAKRIKANHGLE